MSSQRIGRYEIKRLLGRGSLSQVYLARDPVIDRSIALKVLRLDDLEHTSAEDYRRRFLREARAAGRLSHPGIVTIFDAGEDAASGLLFIAMEHVDGNSLKEILRSGTRFSAARVADLGRAVAEALDYSHRNGVVHRDIKPANIMLTRDGSTKIADFGIARLDTTGHTLEGTLLGTPSYMSPEQVEGGTVDGRTDIYSLGVVLFLLLTGKLPINATSLGELSMKIVSQPPTEIGELRPELETTFGPVLRRCLAKQPKDRYQSGAELAEALVRLAGRVDDSEPGPAAADGISDPGATVTVPGGIRPRGAPASAGGGFRRTSETLVMGRGPIEGGTPEPAQASRPARGRWSAAVLCAVVVIGTAALWATYRGRESGQGRSVEPAGAPDMTRARLDAANARMRADDLSGAIVAAERVLARDPTSAEAQTIVAEARRRLDLLSRPAIVTADFDAPAGRGTIEFTLDGRTLAPVSWDFTHKIIFGIRVGGKGTVHARVVTPPGTHILQARVKGDKDGLLGEAFFQEEFSPASRWALSVGPSSEKGKLAVSLRQIGVGNVAASPTAAPQR